MLLRSAWMVAWLIVSLKTQTFGPNAAPVAPGHIEDAGAAWLTVTGVAAATVAGATASPAPGTGTARSMAGRRRRGGLAGRRRPGRAASGFAGPRRDRAGADPNGPFACMMGLPSSLAGQFISRSQAIALAARPGTCRCICITTMCACGVSGGGSAGGQAHEVGVEVDGGL